MRPGTAGFHLSRCETLLSHYAAAFTAIVYDAALLASLRSNIAGKTNPSV